MTTQRVNRREFAAKYIEGTLTEEEAQAMIDDLARNEAEIYVWASITLEEMVDAIEGNAKRELTDAEYAKLKRISGDYDAEMTNWEWYIKHEGLDQAMEEIGMVGVDA
jgi:hypothetical protein